MPLIHGKSKQAFEKNLKSEMSAGKPKDQSLAIAYAIKKRAAQKKMAYGGSVSKPTPTPPQPLPPPLDSSEDTRKFQIAKAFKKRYASGGMVNESLNPYYEPEHEAKNKVLKQYDFSSFDQSHEDIDEPKEPDEPIYASSENMPNHMFAHGGMLHDMMEKRKMAMGGDCYADGGMITNLGHDESEDQNADFLSDEEQDPYAHYNEFDEFKTKPKRRSILEGILSMSRAG